MKCMNLKQIHIQFISELPIETESLMPVMVTFEFTCMHFKVITDHQQSLGDRF
jgi:hypothetical protein